MFPIGSDSYCLITIGSDFKLRMHRRTELAMQLNLVPTILLWNSTKSERRGGSRGLTWDKLVSRSDHLPPPVYDIFWRLLLSLQKSCIIKQALRGGLGSCSGHMLTMKIHGKTDLELETEKYSLKKLFNSFWPFTQLAWQQMKDCTWQLMTDYPWQLAYYSWWQLAYDSWWQIAYASAVIGKLSSAVIDKMP